MSFSDEPISYQKAGLAAQMAAQLQAGTTAPPPLKAMMEDSLRATSVNGPSMLQLVYSSLQFAVNETLGAVARLESKLTPVMGASEVPAMTDTRRSENLLPPAQSAMGQALNDLAATLNNNIVPRLNELTRSVEV